MLFLFEYSYVGILDPSVTEEVIMMPFGQIGTVSKDCKIIHEVKSIQTWYLYKSFPTFSSSDLHLVMSGQRCEWQSQASFMGLQAQ
jgi:hypothetical protein